MPTSTEFSSKLNSMLFSGLFFVAASRNNSPRSKKNSIVFPFGCLVLGTTALAVPDWQKLGNKCRLVPEYRKSYRNLNIYFGRAGEGCNLRSTNLHSSFELPKPAFHHRFRQNNRLAAFRAGRDQAYFHTHGTR